MAISLIAFDTLDFRTLGYPQNGAPFSPPIVAGADLRRPETRKPGVHARDRRISTVSGSASASRVACSWSSWPEVGHTRAEPFSKRSIMHPKKPAGSCSRSATSTRLNAAYADSEPAARCVMLIAAVRAGPSAHESIESSSAGPSPDASCPRVRWAKAIHYALDQWESLEVYRCRNTHFDF